MSALYLYAITDRLETPLPEGSGLEGAALESIVYRDITAIVSPLATGQVQPTAAKVWLHEQIIESLMADRTALPARFGLVLKSPKVAQDDLVERYNTYMADLDRVRGRVELGLRVLWREPSPGSGSATRARDGFTYLMERLAEEQRVQAERREAEAQVAHISRDLVALAVDHVEEVLVSPRMLLKAAYLVEATTIGAFQQAVNEQRDGHPSLSFLCTGPWPAYHFVGFSDK
jgi:hypothetical protein